MSGPTIILPRYRTVQASFTRPADTTAYTAGDVVCNSTSAPTVLTFKNFTREQNGSSQVVQAICIDEANVATKPDLQLWLFDTTIAAVNDNAAFAPSNTEIEGLVGVLAFPTASWVVGLSGSGASGNCACDAQGVGIAINTKAGGDLYGVLVTRNAYVPISAEKFTIRIKVADGVGQ